MSESPLLNAMTVDVEEHFQVSAFASSVRPEDWTAHGSRVQENTERLLGLFDETGIQATFFVLGWVAERCPDLCRRIVARGHEIGCHGYSHTLVYEQSPETFREELRRARAVLQDQSGQPVDGHRAASFSIGRGNLWALDVIAEAGFRYDSSLFPVVHDVYGLPGAPRRIHRLRTRAGHTLIEVPPSTLLLGRFSLPVAGGGYLRLYPTAFTRWVIRRLNRAERIAAVVYVHPWEVDPEQPRLDGPLLSRLRHYVNLSKTMAKLRRLIDSARFGPMSAVLAETTELQEITL